MIKSSFFLKKKENLWKIEIKESVFIVLFNFNKKKIGLVKEKLINFSKKKKKVT